MIKLFQNTKIVLVTLFLTAVFMHFEKLIFWDWSFVRLWDEGNNVLPYHLTDVGSLGDKVFSFWQPKYTAGVDLLATGTRTGPETFLFSLIPSWVAYGLYKILGLFFGAFFIFKLLRDRLETNSFAAMLAGIVFMVIQPDILWNKLSLLALPAAIYTISWGASQKNKGIAIAFATGIIYQLGGQIVLSLSLMSSVLFWLIFVERLSLRHAIILFIPFFIGVLAAEVHTLWAFVENADLSHRNHFSVDGPEAHAFLERFQTIAFYVPTIFFAIVVLISKNKSTTSIKKNVVVFIFVCLVNLYHPLFDAFRYLFQDLSTLIVAYSVPKGLDATIWSAVSVGLSLDYILHNEKFFRIPLFLRQTSMFAIITSGLIFSIVVGIIAEKVGRIWDMLYDENFAYMYRHPDLLRLAADNEHTPPYRVATPFIVTNTGYAIPTFAWSYGFETVDGYVSMYSKRYYNYWLRILAEHEGSLRYKQFKKTSSAIYLFGNPTDRGPMCLDQRISCPIEFEKDYDLELLSLANVRYFISARKLSSPHLVLLPSSTRQALVKRQTAKLRERLKLKIAGEYVGPPLYVYKNKLAFPRFFLTGGIKIFESSKNMLLSMSQASAEDLQNTAYLRGDDLKERNLDKKIEKQFSSQKKGGAVEIIKYGRDEIILKIETDRPQMFVASNNFSPHWRASLNNLETPIIPVYNTFQGVVVPSGLHTLRLRYLPPYSPKTYLSSK